MSRTIECIIELKDGNNVLKIVSNLVRCKDCTYWEQAKPDSGACYRAFEITAYANDFCSYGKRREMEAAWNRWEDSDHEKA